MEDPPSKDGQATQTYHHGRKPFFGVGASALVVGGFAWACLRWRPSRVQIEGGSMAPTLAPGDWALVVTPPRFAVGDVVVVEHPQGPSDEPAYEGYEMVKRIAAGPGDRIAGRELGENEFWVQGDMASASTDSRHFGPVRLEGLKARVLLVYWPKHRRRVIGRSPGRLPKSRP